MSWFFPIVNCRILPTNPHPGSFGAIRKYDIHTGVDLYTQEQEPVFSVEHGKIIAIENYTGPDANSPWWLPTKSILVLGESGVVCYGEVEPFFRINVGDVVNRSQRIGTVIPVLRPDQERPDIPFHSRFMLHFEWYTKDTTESVIWNLQDEKPKNLLDPSKKLIHAAKWQDLLDYAILR